jgi:hypothetical protein
MGFPLSDRYRPWALAYTIDTHFQGAAYPVSWSGERRGMDRCRNEILILANISFLADIR